MKNDTCLPWPLSIVCWMDNRHGVHDDDVSWVCRLHDRVMIWWWTVEHWYGWIVSSEVRRARRHE